MIFENSSLKDIFGQNMSYPPKWSLTDDSRFSQAAIFKYLGLLIDELLTWKDDVDEMVKKISKAIGALRRVRPLYQ